MGADEKHAATYHGAEYTPDTTRVRHGYVDHVDYSAQLHGLPSNDKGAGEAFDRWLETVRAEAKAEAWDEGWCVGWGNAWDSTKLTGTDLVMSDNPYKENQS